MEQFRSFHGIITTINDFIIGVNEEQGCNKLMAVNDGHGNIVHFVVKPNTYFIDQTMVRVGDQITGFYDASVPVPMDFPTTIPSSCYGKVCVSSKCKSRSF